MLKLRTTQMIGGSILLKIDYSDKKPIWQQLVDQAIHNITTGNWPPGQQLIPSRELAHILGVSRSTIQIVYEELGSRGYTITAGRGGTRVNEWNPVIISDKEKDLQGPVLPSLLQLSTAVNHLDDWFKGKDEGDVEIDFSPHEPYYDSHLHKNWRQSFNHAFREIDLSIWGTGNSYGFDPLRQQIQRYLSLERGIHVQIDQIILTSGAQHSIDLIAQALLSEGDTVSVEDPGFPATWIAMKYRNMKVVPVPVDKHGIKVEKIPLDSKLTYVTPSHQCATGVILSASRRQQLVHKAIENRSWIVEDDYDSEFRYRGEPLPTLFSQNPNNTLYLKSFSKMIAPGIRISAIVGPSDAIAQIARVQKLTYRHLPIMEQLTLTYFIEQGHFMRHTRRTRNVYERRHVAMTKAIESSGLGKHFKLSGVETGLHMLLEANDTFAEEEMTLQALDKGVRVYPLRPYCLEIKRKGWVLGFSKVNETLIEQGIYRLASLF